MGDLVAFVSAFDNDFRLGKTVFDVAVFAFNLEENVLARMLDAGRELLVMQDGRARQHCLLRVKHRRQNFVIHLNEAAGFFGNSFGIGDDGRDALTDVTNDLIENEGVIRIHTIVIVQGRGVWTRWHILVRKHGVNARQCSGFIRADGGDVGVSVGRAQNLDVEHSLHL